MNHTIFTALINKNYSFMIWDILSQEEKNTVLLKLMVHVTKADNTLQEGEFAYLLQLCKQLRLDPELIRKFIVESNDLNEILPSSEQERMQILYHLLFTMKSDNAINNVEEKLVYQLAFKLGFSEDMTRDFITLMHQYTIDTVPLNSMLDIIRKHNN